MLRALIERYLGDTKAPPGPRLLAADREEIRITVDPDRIHSWDFTARMSAQRRPRMTPTDGSGHELFSMISTNVPTRHP
jgi:hypothetical protein